MTLDHRLDDIDAGVVYVIAGLKEASHPRHVSARHVQQTHPRQATHGAQLGQDTVQRRRELLRPRQGRSTTCKQRTMFHEHGFHFQTKRLDADLRLIDMLFPWRGRVVVTMPTEQI